MLFVIVKMVCPDTHADLSDINMNLEIMRMSQFKHGIPKADLQVAEWTNEISSSGEKTEML